MTQLLDDLNAIASGYILNSGVGGFRYKEYFIIRKHTNEIDFVTIYLSENRYLGIRTSEYSIDFKGRGDFNTKNIAKKLHKQCNNLMFRIDNYNENAYKTSQDKSS